MTSESEVTQALATIVDPEMNVSIVEMGLVYKVQVDAGDNIQVDYTLTSPYCPSGEYIERCIEAECLKLSQIPPTINLVWEPEWTPEKMSEEARFGLGYPI